MGKIAVSGVSLLLFLSIAVCVSSSPETERIKRCRPVFDKCMKLANTTSNPLYKGMEQDARNTAIKAEREKCTKSYNECK